MESGCKALCCFGPQIRVFDSTEADVLRWFPTARKMSLLNIFVRRNPASVFYLDRGHGEFYVDITGYCPNLDSGFNCSIQDTKPPACKDYGRGQDDCKLIRLDANLQTFRQWDSNQSQVPSEVLK